MSDDKVFSKFCALIIVILLLQLDGRDIQMLTVRTTEFPCEMHNLTNPALLKIHADPQCVYCS